MYSTVFEQKKKAVEENCDPAQPTPGSKEHNFVISENNETRSVLV